MRAAVSSGTSGITKIAANEVPCTKPLPSLSSSNVETQWAKL
jgi:hypothetical protein